MIEALKCLKYMGVFALLISLLACKEKPIVDLETVTVGAFARFVEETGYVTDAERYGWSIVQETVDDFVVLYGIDWRCPNGRVAASLDLPVTQLSYTDASSYADWAGVRIPTYAAYWALVKTDQRPINTASTAILPNAQVHVVGNVWDITLPDTAGNIRLAGGSYLCNTNTCNGASPKRELWVDSTTGNTHIGFSVFR